MVSAAAAVVATAAAVASAAVVAAAAEDDENQNEPEQIVAVAVIVAEHILILSPRRDFASSTSRARKWDACSFLRLTGEAAPHRRRLILCDSEGRRSVIQG